MGMKIIGKEYREATCVTCDWEFKVDESNLNGLTEDDVKELANCRRPEYKIGDDVCLNCCIDIFEAAEDIEPLK